MATIPPEKLIFLDESGVTTQMTRLWGRAPKGERIAEATPQGHWKVLTTLGAMSRCGIQAAMTIESATDGDLRQHHLRGIHRSRKGAQLSEQPARTAFGGGP